MLTALGASVDPVYEQKICTLKPNNYLKLLFFSADFAGVQRSGSDQRGVGAELSNDKFVLTCSEVSSEFFIKNFKLIRSEMSKFSSKNLRLTNF